jgi:hypothetical protein
MVVVTLLKSACYFLEVQEGRFAVPPRFVASSVCNPVDHTKRLMRSIVTRNKRQSVTLWKHAYTVNERSTENLVR